MSVSWWDNHQDRAGQQQGNHQGRAGQQLRQCKAKEEAVQGNEAAVQGPQPTRLCHLSFLCINLLYGKLIFGFLLFCSSPSINKGLNPFYGGSSFQYNLLKFIDTPASSGHTKANKMASSLKSHARLKN